MHSPTLPFFQGGVRNLLAYWIPVIVNDGVGLLQDIYRFKLYGAPRAYYLTVSSDGSLTISTSASAATQWFVVPRFVAIDLGYVNIATEQA